MFGRKLAMQVVPVDALAGLLAGLGKSATAQPSVTIYIQELHIHAQDGGSRRVGQQQFASLPEPQSTYTLPMHSVDPNAAAAPPALRCTVCGDGIPNGHEVWHEERYYHPRCWQGGGHHVS